MRTWIHILNVCIDKLDGDVFVILVLGEKGGGILKNKINSKKNQKLNKHMDDYIIYTSMINVLLKNVEKKFKTSQDQVFIHKSES